MDGTPAPPSPPESVSFGQMPWTIGAFNAIEKLIENEKIENPIVIGHWMTGTQLALRLALKYPDKIKAIIIPSGYACFVMTDTSVYKPHPPLEQRIAGIDRYMIPKWFKTVTRETWDDNNYMPYDYAVNPIMGLRIWREAAEPPLHVWVRYLNEFYCQDITQQLDSLTVPTLLLYPGLEGLYHEPNQNYMQASCYTSWAASAPNHKMITSVTIPNSRICMWIDQPQRFEEEVDKFLAGVE
jgi:pimeloyl-ACP methyl ester carboxylesterase